MFKHYLKIALRNLEKNKLHTSINILGLAIGFMVAILSYLYIQNELSYEAWIPDNERIYRVFRQGAGQQSGGWTHTPPALAPALATEIAGIESATKLEPQEELLFTVGEKSIYIKNIAYVDSAFFSVFAFPFKAGNPRTAISGQNSIVISERIGQLLFGEEEPLGRVITINGDTDYLINGVLENRMETTFINQEVFIKAWEGGTSQWMANRFATYIKKEKQANINQIAERTDKFLYPIYKKEYAENNLPFGSQEEMFKTKFQPLQEIHLNSEGLGSTRNPDGDLTRLFVFGLIALVVLLIAGINYINLATARGALRAKEVGVRKVSGANRGQLIIQFLLESVLQSLFALCLALILAEFFLPIFNDITNRELSFLQGGWTKIILPATAISIFIGLTAGLYPAFFLSKINTLKVLKSGLLKINSGYSFRKVLVVSQFSLSVILIIIMLFAFKQVQFMQNMDLGFDQEQVLVINVNKYDSGRKVEQIKNQFQQIKGVENFALSNELPGASLNSYTMNIQGIEELYVPNLMFINNDLDQTLNLELTAGRFFSTDFATDTINAWVVNETFLKENNMTNPIGKGLKLVWEQEYGRIIGVVKDFHFIGLQNNIEPLAISARKNIEGYTKASFKLRSDNLPETITAVTELWKQIEPEHPVRYTFLDEKFAAQYEAQESFGRTMLYATVLAIFIAMLGLFGLASFMAVQRTKEIGVRKVLGASVLDLIRLLVTDFVKLVLIAGIIAVPVGYWLVNIWLMDFAFRTKIDVFPFALAISSAIILAILTVSYQSIKVSYANPVKALKTE